VKTRRADKLKGTDDELFTGEFWSGIKGLSLGLVDGIGDLRDTLRTRYGDDVKLRLIEPKRSLFALPNLGFPARAGLGSDILAALEDRALWSRFGL
jgi:ClpP class serine protease